MGGRGLRDTVQVFLIFVMFLRADWWTDSHAVSSSEVSVDDAPAAQVLHPPRDVQHELQQRLQRQVLVKGHRETSLLRV